MPHPQPQKAGNGWLVRCRRNSVKQSCCGFDDILTLLSRKTIFELQVTALVRRRA